MSKCLFVWALLVLSFCMVLIPSPWSRPSLLMLVLLLLLLLLLLVVRCPSCFVLFLTPFLSFKCRISAFETNEFCVRVVLCTSGLPADLPAFFPQTLGSTPQVHHKIHKCASSQQTQNATIRPE